MRITAGILFILVVGCASVQPTTISTFVTKTVHDTLYKRVDSVIRTTVEVAHYILSDTATHTIHLAPVAGDNYPQLQDAIKFCITYPGWNIRLAAGNYYIMQPLVAAKTLDGIYQQVTFDMEGFCNAKNAPGQNTTNIICIFNQGFGLGIQQGKGCSIKNISFLGDYTFPNSLNLLSLDTLSDAAWNVGVGSNPTSPYAGIVIDPFSDPGYYDAAHQMYKGLETYYLPGMNQSGSTAIDIEGCAFFNFLVGTMITPSNQLNGELINVRDCHYEKCKSAYAFTQAQSKTNTFKDIEAWSMIRTVIDGGGYGFSHGDGATCPFVDNVNIAGGTYQLISASSNTFPISMNRVYAENLFKIGSTGGNAGTHFTDCQIDFQTGPGLPSPDCWTRGPRVTWDGGMLRYYGSPRRIVLNWPGNIFTGVAMSAPPVCLSNPGDNSLAWPNTQRAKFRDVIMFYSGDTLCRNDYDSIVTLCSSCTVHIDRSTFSGYVAGITAAPGDLLLTTRWLEGTQITTFEYPLGYVTSVSKDTVFLQNMGVGIHDGDRAIIYDAKMKSSL